MEAPNRRKTTRSPVDMPAKTVASGAPRLRKITDLSLDGAFVEGESAEPGTLLRLALPLHDGQPALHARSHVVRQDDRGAAVRFVGLRTKDMVRIAEELFGEDVHHPVR
jgi:hypothetical protein